MITKEVIDRIYKQFGKKPQNPETLNIGLLFEKAGILHDILIDPETGELTIESIPEDSPFHSVPLGNISAILPFEEWVAIVLHSSIIFLNVKKPVTSIHLRTPKKTIWDRISNMRHVALL